MSSALPGANFEVGAAIPGDPNLNSRPGVNTFEFYRALCREFARSPSWSFAGSTQVLSGSGTTIISLDDACAVYTGATHASTAGRYKEVQLPGTATRSGIQWDKKFFIFFVCFGVVADFTNLTLRVLLTQSTTIGNLAAHGLGLQTNGANINLATYGTGGSQQLVSAATNLVTNDRVGILIEHDPAVADRLYINGVLKATQSTAADIPSTEPTADCQFFVSIARSGGADIGDESWNCSAPIYANKF